MADGDFFFLLMVFFWPFSIIILRRSGDGVSLLIVNKCPLCRLVNIELHIEVEGKRKVLVLFARAAFSASLGWSWKLL